MAGQATSAGSKIALDALSGRATQTARTMYLALLTAAPTDASTLATVTEVSATGYARQTCAMSDPTTTEASTNTALLTFGPFDTDPASATHCALVSAVSGTVGDITFYWTLDVARDAAVGDSITVAVGALSMGAE